jgi:hypothetical protein
MELRDDDNEYEPDMPDEVAMVTKGNQFNKKSPNSITGSTRKGPGPNLANISNTVHTNNNRQGGNSSQMR